MCQNKLVNFSNQVFLGKSFPNVMSGVRWMSLTPLTHEYFDRCEEIAYNSVKTFDGTFLINLKKNFPAFRPDEY